MSTRIYLRSFSSRQKLQCTVVTTNTIVKSNTHVIYKNVTPEHDVNDAYAAEGIAVTKTAHAPAPQVLSTSNHTALKKGLSVASSSSFFLILFFERILSSLLGEVVERELLL